MQQSLRLAKLLDTFVCSNIVLYESQLLKSFRQLTTGFLRPKNAYKS